MPKINDDLTNRISDEEAFLSSSEPSPLNSDDGYLASSEDSPLESDDLTSDDVAGLTATPAVAESDDLYSDSRSPLIGDAKSQFEQYIALLDQITNEAKGRSDGSASAYYSDEIQRFYVKLVMDAFSAKKIEPPKGMEICFTGSLAKRQATIFSDLDAFALTQTEEDVAIVKPIFESINNILYRIFEIRNQLCPDVLQMNPAKLLGTPEQIKKKLLSGDIPIEETVRAMASSKSIEVGSPLHANLLAELRNTFPGVLSSSNLYLQLFQLFTAPPERLSLISIKQHLTRPVDFLLMGLRAEFKLDDTDISAAATFTELRAKKLIPDEQIDLIESTFNQSHQLRFSTHLAVGKEDDTTERTPLVESLLQNIDKLRTIAEQRKSNLESPKASDSRYSFFRKATTRFSLFFSSSFSSSSSGSASPSVKSPEINASPSTSDEQQRTNNVLEDTGSGL